jgi:hypothetical protein
MKSREQWRPVLEAETKRWQSKSWRRLLADLAEQQVYEIEFETNQFQVEVQLLENTDKYVHVCVSVDDGSLPASLFPLNSSFIVSKY